MNADFLRQCLQILHDMDCGVLTGSYHISHLTFGIDGDSATFGRDSNGEWYLMDGPA